MGGLDPPQTNHGSKRKAIIFLLSFTPLHLWKMHYPNNATINTITTVQRRTDVQSGSSHVCSWVPRARKLMNDGESNTASPGTRRGSADNRLLYLPCKMKKTKQNGNSRSLLEVYRSYRTCYKCTNLLRANGMTTCRCHDLSWIFKNLAEDQNFDMKLSNCIIPLSDLYFLFLWKTNEQIVLV